jgi:hypothetical protein
VKHTRVRDTHPVAYCWAFCVAVVCFLTPPPARAERQVSLAFSGSGVAELQKDWPTAVRRYQQLEKTKYVSAGKPALLRIPGMNGRFEANRLDALLPAGPTRLTMTLPDIGNVVAVGDRARPSKLAPRLRIWQGKVTVGAGEDILDAPAIVAWDDRSLRIDVDMPGRILRVRTITPDTFSLYTVDTRGLPPDHDQRKPAPGAAKDLPGARVVAKGNAGKGTQDGTSESGTRPPVKFGAAKPILEPGRLTMNSKRVVLHAAFAFTREGAEEILNEDPSQGAPGQAPLQQLLVDYAEIQVAKANAALADSGVDAELQVVAVTAFPLNEPSGNNLSSAMSKLMPASSTHAADLHCWWGKAGKDPAAPKEKPGPANLLFLVGSFGGPAAAGAPVQGICGMSWKPHGTHGTAIQFANSLDEVEVSNSSSGLPPGTGYYGYAILKNACVEQHFSLLHELGHILGTDHQREPGETAAVNGSEPLVLDFVPQTKSFGFGFHNPSNTRVTVEVVGDDLRAKRSPLYSSPLLAPAGKWGSATRNSVKLMNIVAPVLGQRSPPLCR